MPAIPDSHHRNEKRAGLLLIAAAGAALALANSRWAGAYHALLDVRFGPALPRLGVMTLEQWIADAAMALFFLLVGLEVKREWAQGSLATAAARRLPIIAALAGMAVPALVYLAVTHGDPGLQRGWAIPAATDIAFAIGVLALLGRHAPPSLKLLLVTIAIVDDIGAVIVIAFAYTSDLDPGALAAALAVAAAMAGMGRLGVRRLWPFLAGFVLLWLLVLASGIHPTIAGIVAALTVPPGRGEARSPLRRLEHALHPLVMFGVVPLFGLASAGVVLGGGGGALASGRGETLALAVMLGLVVGKPAGIMAALWAAVRSGLAPMPNGAGWRHLWGGAALCGIGFTMSLFIAALAFAAPGLAAAAKLGTLAGSLFAALVGFAILRGAAPATPDAADEARADEIFSTETLS